MGKHSSSTTRKEVEASCCLYFTRETNPHHSAPPICYFFHMKLAITINFRKQFFHGTVNLLITIIYNNFGVGKQCMPILVVVWFGAQFVLAILWYFLQPWVTSFAQPWNKLGGNKYHFPDILSVMTPKLSRRSDSRSANLKIDLGGKKRYSNLRLLLRHQDYYLGDHFDLK